MGAGRKTQTFNVDTRIPASESGYISARNLRKNDLGGVIFGCKHTTMPECLSKQLFGLPAPHFSYVRNIGPGLPIFHFNYSDRKLHGIYESASHGQMCIDAYAWTDGGAERTAFPAQVRIRIREQCNPLTENEFKTVIEDNYYSPHLFWFELDHSQTRSLISLFKPCPSTLVPVLNPFSQANHFPPLPIPKWKSVKDVKATRSGNENKFAILSLDDRDDDYGYLTKATSNATEEIDSKEPASNLADLFAGHLLVGASSSIGVNFNEVPEILDKEPVDEEDYKNVLLKLERLSADCKVNSSRGGNSESTSACIPEDLYNHDRQFLHDSCTLSEKNENLNVGNLHHGNVKKNGPFLDASMKEEQQVAVNCYDGNAKRDIGKVFNESCIFFNEVKDSTSPNLTHGTVELLEAIRELKERTATLEKQQRFAPAAAELNGVIYAVGGYDGQNYLKSAERLDPREVSCSIIPNMITRRGCHSMTVLNEKLFVMGGYDGEEMVSSVEIYDPRANAWMAGEPMKFNRGYGASALVGNSLFIIGGIGNGETILENIECYKEGAGWTNTRLKAVGKRCFFSAIVL